MPNSASHLLELLRRARNSGEQWPKKTGQGLWRALLQATDAEHEVFARRYDQLWRLYNDVLSQARELPVDQDLFVEKWRSPVAQAIAAGMSNAGALSISNPLSQEGVLTSLEFLSKELEGGNGTDQRAQDQLNELQNEVEALIKDVLSSELETGLKLWLVDLLNEVRDAIQAYSILGTKVLEDVLQRTAGVLLLKGKELQESGDQKLTEGVRKMFRKLIDAVTLEKGVDLLEAAGEWVKNTVIGS